MERDTDLGDVLLAIARTAIRRELGFAGTAPIVRPVLAAPAATFVTLRRGDRLRGCIGSVEARRSLGEDVRRNAVAAAFHDPRFPPLAAHELDATAIEVSLLGPSELLPCADEDAAVARLRPGLDGIILECGYRRATFLPQVWEQLADPREFLVALKRKAGLPADGWSTQIVLARYTVTKYGERAPAPV